MAYQTVHAARFGFDESLIRHHEASVSACLGSGRDESLHHLCDQAALRQAIAERVDLAHGLVCCLHVTKSPSGLQKQT
jgi:hypothetical protein